MPVKKETIILWIYFSAMVLFVLIVTFSGGTVSHEAANEASPAAVTHQDDAHTAMDTAAPHVQKEKYLEKVLNKIVAADTTAPETHLAHASVADGATPHKESNAHAAADPFAGKPTPDEAIALLKKGNQRFVHGESIHPHLDLPRLLQAGAENQGDHAYATVLTCSDSRVPVEAIFDAGIMNIFVVRVAGNVCDVDERGSIEYGLAHVNTPVLVVLGHTQCGAVTAVTHSLLGHGHALERNIPPLVDNIVPAVKKAMAAHPEVKGEAIIPMAIEENIWTGIEELFMESPVTRKLVTAGKVKVVGAIYNVGEGTIEWLPQEKTMAILDKVEKEPKKAVE